MNIQEHHAAQRRAIFVGIAVMAIGWMLTLLWWHFSAYAITISNYDIGNKMVIAQLSVFFVVIGSVGAGYSAWHIARGNIKRVDTHYLPIQHADLTQTVYTHIHAHHIIHLPGDVVMHVGWQPDSIDDWGVEVFQGATRRRIEIPRAARSVQITDEVVMLISPPRAGVLYGRFIAFVPAERQLRDITGPQLAVSNG